MDLGQQDGSCPVIDASREREAGGTEIRGGGGAGPYVENAPEHNQEQAEHNGRADQPAPHPKPPKGPSDATTAGRAEAAVRLERSATGGAERSRRFRGCPIHVDGLDYNERLIKPPQTRD